ncbi:ATP-binding protein [Prosthecochloris sp. CIB 2401]|uniref:ATP-binding protein n=1 Tax=Prosthecochloris sp. CIB 2401 TaxID=1868325 RepID=UPI0012EA48D8|nr:ATP-binding protein [Prosthecochloris sp. CIB 2401]
MRVHRPHNTLVIASILFMITLIASLWGSYQFYVNQKQEHVNVKVQHLEKSIAIILHFQEILASTYFEHYIQNDIVLNLMREASTTEDDTKKSAARKQLQTYVTPIHEKLKQNHFTHLHFHLPDTESFLRTHAPEKYGDKLAPYRRTVVMANTTISPVSGYEMGRVIGAYRNVFPLVQHGEHLGSAELSMDFGYIQQTLQETYKGEYILLLRRDVCDDMLFAEYKESSQRTLLTDDFVFNASSFTTTSLKDSINRQLAPQLSSTLSKYEPGMLSTKINGMYYTLTLVPFYDIDDKIVGYIGAYQRDNTQQRYFISFIFRTILIVLFISAIFAYYLSIKRGSDRLQVETAQLNRLVTSTRAGLWSYSVTSDTYDFNPYCLEMLRHELQAVNGHALQLTDFIHPEDVSSFSGELERLLSGSQDSFETECRLQTRNGDTLWALIRAETTEHDRQHKASIISGLILDITERKKAEEMIRENLRLKDDFISSISHELRTPLFSILGFTSILIKEKEKMDNKTRDEFISIIHEESSRLAVLIEDILKISLVESSKATYNKAGFEVADLPEALRKKWTKKAEARTLSLLFSLDAAVGKLCIYGDKETLIEALSKLVDNAIKFTPEGGTVKIGFELDSDRKNLLIHIIDEGQGIETSKWNCIFEKFYRSGRKGEETKGTGLGLPIAREIITEHGGVISVTSCVGKGSDFTVTLPLFIT